MCRKGFHALTPKGKCGQAATPPTFVPQRTVICASEKKKGGTTSSMWAQEKGKRGGRGGTCIQKRKKKTSARERGKEKRISTVRSFKETSRPLSEKQQQLLL